MRYQMAELPRMRSMRMSSSARWAAASGCFSFQRARPASAAALSGDCATMMRGVWGCGGLGFCAGWISVWMLPFLRRRVRLQLWSVS